MRGRKLPGSGYILPGEPPTDPPEAVDCGYCESERDGEPLCHRCRQRLDRMTEDESHEAYLEREARKRENT